MDRQRAVALVLVGVLVVGLGVAAGALDAVSQGGGSGAGTGPGNGDGDRNQIREQEPMATDPLPTIPPLLRQILGAILLALLLASVLNMLRSPQRKAALVAVSLILVGALLLELRGRRDPTAIGGVNRTNVSTGGGGEGVGVAAAGEQAAQSVDPPVVLAGLVVVLLLGGAALVVFSGRSDDHTATATEAGSAEMETVARTAGAAADRVAAGVDVDNEIYRAWREMTTALDIERPDSATPAEFADEAVAAGFDRDDVTELTRLFEETRYGSYPVTDDRASRAERALRRIERYEGDR